MTKLTRTIAAALTAFVLAIGAGACGGDSGQGGGEDNPGQEQQQDAGGY